MRQQPGQRPPVHRRTTFSTGRPADRAPLPWWQAEAPFALLLASGLAALLFVLDQGGGWRNAVFAACVVLGAPGAAIESMAGLARVAVQLRGEDR